MTIVAAEMLGSDPAKVAMTVAWGNAWTNMIQPFWALPALVIAGLKAKDIMGFCVIVLVVSGVVIGLDLAQLMGKVFFYENNSRGISIAVYLKLSK